MNDLLGRFVMNTFTYAKTTWTIVVIALSLICMPKKMNATQSIALFFNNGKDIICCSKNGELKYNRESSIKTLLQNPKKIPSLFSLIANNDNKDNSNKKLFCQVFLVFVTQKSLFFMKNISPLIKDLVWSDPEKFSSFFKTLGDIFYQSKRFEKFCENGTLDLSTVCVGPCQCVKKLLPNTAQAEIFMRMVLIPAIISTLCEITNKNIIDLNLKNCSLAWFPFEFIKHTTSVTATLKSINLSDNCFNNNGKSLAENLQSIVLIAKVFPTLEKLILCNNNFLPDEKDYFDRCSAKVTDLDKDSIMYCTKGSLKFLYALIKNKKLSCDNISEIDTLVNDYQKKQQAAKQGFDEVAQAIGRSKFAIEL